MQATADHDAHADHAAPALPRAAAPVAPSAPLPYLLHLADNALVLGQRNAEWCGHAPILEEDLAMANNSLDLIGQARLLYQHAAERLNHDVRAPRGAAWPAGPITEDTLAYFRGDTEFRNYVMLELPHHTGVVPAAGGTRDWLVRLGDGTDESHRRAQAALDYLMPFTAEFWSASALETEAIDQGAGVDAPSLRAAWEQIVDEAIAEATLKRPADTKRYVPEGKRGVHSEYLSYLLGEMQSLARQHPGAVW